MSINTRIQQEIDNKKYTWKNINIKMRDDEIALLNQRLKLFGYETPGQLLKDFRMGRFHKLTEDKQIDNLYENKSGINQQTYMK